MPELTLIIPVKNEEQNISSLAEKIRTSLKDIDHELIWVNDGSTDYTSAEILNKADERTLLIEFLKNYGQSAAMKAGIDHANGKFLAFLDGDGQNDPADIPAMLSLIKKGNWGMVAGLRKDRHDSLTKKIPSAIANTLIRLVTGVRIRDLGCTIKVIRRDLAVQLPMGKGMHRFIPVLVKRCGGSMTQIPVQHHPRLAGHSKYGLERTIKVVYDLMKLSFKKKLEKPKAPYTIRLVHYPRKAFSQSGTIQSRSPEESSIP